ncbi:MAG: hypothetical protein LBI35_01285 [Burkholderiales bacterium]|nr:hypothetical protein [Burkholderiales bacterium]
MHLDDFEDYTKAIEQHRAVGSSPDLIAEYEAMQAEERADFDVDADEVEVVSMFERLGNHWRIEIGMSGGLYLGCDIGLAVKLLEYRKAENIGDLVDDLLLMEAAAKGKLNEILQRRRDEQRKPRI